MSQCWPTSKNTATVQVANILGLSSKQPKTQQPQTADDGESGGGMSSANSNDDDGGGEGGATLQGAAQLSSCSISRVGEQGWGEAGCMSWVGEQGGGGGPGLQQQQQQAVREEERGQLASNEAPEEFEEQSGREAMRLGELFGPLVFEFDGVRCNRAALELFRQSALP